jgi:hypothetical protein
MLSDDEEVGNLMEDLGLGVSGALGSSPSEVHAQYFWDSDEGKDGGVGRESVSECKHRREYQLYREDAVFE